MKILLTRLRWARFRSLFDRNLEILIGFHLVSRSKAATSLELGRMVVGTPKILQIAGFAIGMAYVDCGLLTQARCGRLCAALAIWRSGSQGCGEKRQDYESYDLATTHSYYLHFMSA